MRFKWIAGARIDPILPLKGNQQISGVRENSSKHYGNCFTAQSDDLVAYVKLYLGANKLNQMIPLKEPTQTKQFIWPGLNVVSRNKNLEWLFDCGD